MQRKNLSGAECNEQLIFLGVVDLKYRRGFLQFFDADEKRA